MELIHDRKNQDPSLARVVASRHLGLGKLALRFDIAKSVISSHLQAKQEAAEERELQELIASSTGVIYHPELDTTYKDRREELANQARSDAEQYAIDYELGTPAQIGKLISKLDD